MLPSERLKGSYSFKSMANEVSLSKLDVQAIGATLSNDRFGKANSVTYFNNISNYFVQGSSDTVDLNLKAFNIDFKTTSEAIGQVKLILKNENLQNNATNVKVGVNAIFSQPFSIFQMSLPSSGTFDVNSNLWTIPIVLPGDSATLVLNYKILNGGPWYLEAEVYSVDQKDSDSTPMNFLKSEDDYSRTCFSNPIFVSNSNFVGRQIIIEDSSINNIIWKKDGIVIPNQNSNTLNVTTAGTYSFESPNFICPSQGCCPFIFETGVIDPNCCEPLEYILKGIVFHNTIAPFEIIGNDANMEDSDVASIVPDNNYGQNDHMDPYAWTQNGILNIKRNYLKFDLSYLPQNVIIDSAVLTLFFGQSLIDIAPMFTGHEGDNVLEVERVLSNWSENTITWNNMPNVTSTNKVVIPKASNPKQNYSINVTNLLKDILETNNYGFMIKHQVETPYKITPFSTSESLDPNLRPRLKVYYH
ncbi:DNRLRE domain-containing protein [Lacihabitans sp. LS3-19]|uniref:DNRLRE domain-containing protein n=1 Tax=Lacihabitans sp. LS3-19 TaxID=2487335 RepID=UPI0020CE1919|nr:DNRLRE domain-containing protein [Lacihabitans sp. LS3-19]